MAIRSSEHSDVILKVILLDSDLEPGEAIGNRPG